MFGWGMWLGWGRGREWGRGEGGFCDGGSDLTLRIFFVFFSLILLLPNPSILFYYCFSSFLLLFFSPLSFSTHFPSLSPPILFFLLPQSFLLLLLSLLFFPLPHLPHPPYPPSSSLFPPPFPISLPLSPFIPLFLPPFSIPLPLSPFIPLFPHPFSPPLPFPLPSFILPPLFPYEVIIILIIYCFFLDSRSVIHLFGISCNKYDFYSVFCLYLLDKWR